MVFDAVEDDGTSGGGMDVALITSSGDFPQTDLCGGFPCLQSFT